MTTIHFVRHGEVYNPDKILYGRLPGFRLSTAGESQAAAAGMHLSTRPLAAVISSPQLRARQTAEHIARPHGLTVEVSALVDEVHSPYEGRPAAELDAQGWLLYTNVLPGYETPADIMARVLRQIDLLRARYPADEVAVVTHGDIVLAVQFWAQGIPFTDETKNSVAVYPATASITSMHFNGHARPQFTYHRPY